MMEIEPAPVGQICESHCGKSAKWDIESDYTYWRFCDDCLDEIQNLKKPELRYEVEESGFQSVSLGSRVRDKKSDALITHPIPFVMADVICRALNEFDRGGSDE